MGFGCFLGGDEVETGGEILFFFLWRRWLERWFEEKAGVEGNMSRWVWCVCTEVE